MSRSICRMFKITPASVTVGLSSAVMMPLDPPLKQEEQEVLIRDLNFFCEPYGLNFFQLGSDSVGADLCVRPGLNVCCSRFKKSCGRPLGDYLPTGPDGLKLNAWMTEIQMFLQNHPVNQIRRDQQIPTVDILWFEKKKLWGWF